MGLITRSLFFDGESGKRKIAEVNCTSPDGGEADKEAVRLAMTSIQKFCEEWNFRVHYTRIWDEDGRTVFDVGSHTEFFLLEPGVGSIV